MSEHHNTEAADGCHEQSGAELGFPLQVGNLRSATLGADLRRVCLCDPVSRAETLMLLHGFNQIPVFEGEIGEGSPPSLDQLRGMVTLQSVARVRLASKGGDPKITAALDTLPLILDKTTDLFRAVPSILSAEAALVHDNGQVCGIVTAYDLTEFLAKSSEPFFVLNEIEVSLRVLIESWTKADHSKNAMGALIEKLKCLWEKNGGDYDWDEFRRALKTARKKRNLVMHGNKHGPDAIHESLGIDQDRHLLECLRSLLDGIGSTPD